MRTILIFLMVAVTVASASAENDRVLADLLAQFVRDEQDRQDCMWRETLTGPRPESSEKLKEIAWAVAALCSQNIRKQILQNITPQPTSRKEKALRSISLERRSERY